MLWGVFTTLFCISAGCCVYPSLANKRMLHPFNHHQRTNGEEMVAELKRKKITRWKNAWSTCTHYPSVVLALLLLSFLGIRHDAISVRQGTYPLLAPQCSQYVAQSAETCNRAQHPAVHQPCMTLRNNRMGPSPAAYIAWHSFHFDSLIFNPFLSCLFIERDSWAESLRNLLGHPDRNFVTLNWQFKKKKELYLFS